MRIHGLSIVYIFVCGGLVTLSCSSNDPAPTPSITSFSPTTGPALAEVVISGLNFSGDNNANDVRFNGVKAQVTASTSTTLTAKVPQDATSGVITVTVNGQSAVSQNAFTINPLVGSWRFTGSTATNCADPANDGAATCTLDCPVLSFTATTATYAVAGSVYNFTYTLTATTLTISSAGGSFSPTYVYNGGQLTLVYPPGDCSVTETYVKL
jgi:hypothetical protein